MDVLTFETYCAVNSKIIKQVTSSWSIIIQLLIHKFSMNHFAYDSVISVCNVYIDESVFLTTDFRDNSH